MPNLPLTDPSANELLGNAQQPQPTSMSQRLRAEIVSGLGSPIITPPGGGGIPGNIPPFDKVISREWVWGQVFPRLDTYDAPGGPMTPHGIVVIGFTPQLSNEGAAVSVAAYPGNMRSCDRACSVSTIAGDFSQAWPFTRYGYDTGIQFVISPRTLRGCPSITPNVRYYINIANIDPGGNWTTTGLCDIRVEIGGPHG